VAAQGGLFYWRMIMSENRCTPDQIEDKLFGIMR